MVAKPGGVFKPDSVTETGIPDGSCECPKAAIRRETDSAQCRSHVLFTERSILNPGQLEVLRQIEGCNRAFKSAIIVILRDGVIGRRAILVYIADRFRPCVARQENPGPS